MLTHHVQSGLVVHAYTPNTQEVEANGIRSSRLTSVISLTQKEREAVGGEREGEEEKKEEEEGR